MAIVIASAALSDDEFLTAFSRCQLPNTLFRHGDHLRLAWIELHRRPFDQALTAVREGIRAYAAHHGQSHLFHETITGAWVRLLATHDEPSFAQFVTENEHRLNAGLLARFWSPSVLQSEAARFRWVAPDRKALPDRVR